LPALWREIGTQLTAIGFWEGLNRPSQFGGIVILPILIALMIPALVTAAAMFSFLFAIVLLARLPFRPIMFPTIASMGAIVQTALVVTGWLATAVLRELSQAAVVDMSNAPDLEVRQLADQLTSAVATLMMSTTLLVVPTVVLVAWSVFLRPSGRAAGLFGRGSRGRLVRGEDAGASSEQLPTFEAPRALEELPAFAAPRTAETLPTIAEPRAPRPTFAMATAGRETRTRAGGPTAASPIVPARVGGWLLVGLGVLMLLFAGIDRLRARPAFVVATPEPGAQVAAAPAAIRVTLDRALQPASTLSVVYLPVVPSLDDISRDIPAVSQLSPSDGDRRTLEVIPPPLARGLYLVRWVAYPAFGGITRHGSFTFGVGAPVPQDRSDMQYSLNERDSGERGRRYTMAGGVLMLVIGALICLRPE
jgi:methionine-rich copper-binding protein CopC